MAVRPENRQDALRSVQFLEYQTHSLDDQREVNDRLIEEMQLKPGECDWNWAVGAVLSAARLPAGHFFGPAAARSVLNEPQSGVSPYGGPRPGYSA